MRVLALSSYPIEAAATRYRLAQFVAPLAERGITLDLRPFLSSQLFASLYRRTEIAGTAFGLMQSALRRFADVYAARDADVMLVQREAMMFGPPLIEWLAIKFAHCPMVLDLDDATYIPYTSPTYGRFGSWLKCFSKTDTLIQWARVVTCGNSSIAEYALSKGTAASVIPTVVDTERFRPAPATTERYPLVLGWMGTHSTFPYLESIFPALQQLARVHRFRLKVIGAGTHKIDIPGVQVESLDWNLEREISDFQSFDLGLYPIIPNEWAAGKSGFKAIQYMAVGIPYVMTPVAVCAVIGEQGVTHLEASTQDEWYRSLQTLLLDSDKRKQMGAAGRRHATEHYTVAAQANKLARALREAVGAGLLAEEACG